MRHPSRLLIVAAAISVACTSPAATRDPSQPSDPAGIPTSGRSDIQAPTPTSGATDVRPRAEGTHSSPRKQGPTSGFAPGEYQYEVRRLVGDGTSIGRPDEIWTVGKPDGNRQTIRVEPGSGDPHSLELRWTKDGGELLKMTGVGGCRLDPPILIFPVLPTDLEQQTRCSGTTIRYEVAASKQAGGWTIQRRWNYESSGTFSVSETLEHPSPAAMPGLMIEDSGSERIERRLVQN